MASFQSKREQGEEEDMTLFFFPLVEEALCVRRPFTRCAQVYGFRLLLLRVVPVM